MKTQNLIKRTLSQPQAITVIRELLQADAGLSSSLLAERVCERLGLFNAKGRPQRSGCLKALRELEVAGHFVLPGARRCRKQRSPRRLGAPVDVPRDVPARAGGLQGLTLVAVESDAQMRVWNELMACEHPRGAGPLVGVQVRYLIGSAHGWLGGLGFGAAALQLKDRDRWIGWDGEGRRKHLHRIVGLSRFLIRPTVTCRNLASRVLAMALRRLPDDVESRCGYRPWLVETFVERARYRGTCFRAANWIEVGETQGRGRQDREKRCAESRKAVFLYPLVADFRARLDGVPEPVLETLDIAEGLEEHRWAEQELGDAPLGDRRLGKRLVESAAIQARAPGRAFSGAAQGDWPRVKGYYRMIDQPEDSAVTPEAILAPHRRRTIARMRSQQTVLCIQDGTDLNYSGLAQCEGLGVIGTNQTGANSRGLHLHSTLAATTEGVPLGVLDAQFRAPQPTPQEPALPARATPIEQKKGFCWIKGLRDSNALAKALPHTRQVCVMDREADFFELFDEPRHRRVELLVRAKHDRCTGGEHKLFETLRTSPVRRHLSIPIPRQSARPKRSKQKPRPRRQARMATVALRCRQIDLLPPSHLKGKAPITLWAVHIREPSPPPNEQPLEWFLLTTGDITDDEQACQYIRWYTLRWRIEDWHRVLKSGCRIEKLAHKSAARLKRAIAINLVIAWRIMVMTLLGRSCPDLPAEVLFSDLEITVLNAYAEKKTPATLATG